MEETKEEKIAKAFLDGTREYSDLIAIFGGSDEDIYRALKKHPVAKYFARIPTELEERVVGLYNDGAVRVSEVCKGLKLNRATVLFCLKRAGKLVTTRGVIVKGPPSTRKDLLKEIELLRRRNSRLEEKIEEIYKICRS